MFICNKVLKVRYVVCFNQTLIFSADCCPTIDITSTSPHQASRFGTYTLTSPLQTTSYAGIDYPVYEKGSNFLSRYSTTGSEPWVIGGTPGVGSGGVFLGPSPQCPDKLTFAQVFTGTQFDNLTPADWSIACNSRKYYSICNYLAGSYG